MCVCHVTDRQKILILGVVVIFNFTVLSLVWQNGYTFTTDRKPVNCNKLVANDSKEFDIAYKTLGKHRKTMLPDNAFVELADNCELFKKSRNYNLEPLSNEEKNFPIAYSILMYRYVDQLELLLRAIYSPQNHYCIHVDQKAHVGVHIGVQAIVKCFPNVFIASKLESVVYAGYSRLQADLNCAEDLLQRDHGWRYFINLAAEMYPLKTNGEIVKILKVYNGSNDISGSYDGPEMSAQEHKWKFKHRIVEHRSIFQNLTKYTIEELGVKNEPPPHNIQVLKGSAYNIFSRGFFEYALQDPVVKDFLNWTKYVYSPDEIFWATIQFTKINPMLKTPGRFTGDVDSHVWSAAFVQWDTPSSHCRGKVLRGICIPDYRDLPELVSTTQLFVNKLLPFDYDSLVLECLSEQLKERTLKHSTFNTSYYRNLPLVQNRI